jgi:hypothetical protein
VPNVKHPHLHLVLCLVQVEVSLEAGDDIIELIFLYHQAGLDRHIMILFLEQILFENVGELQLPIVGVHLAG